MVAPSSCWIASAVRAMQMKKAQPCAPVIRCLRPSMTQSEPSRRAVVSSIAGSEPGAGRRLGHGERRAHLARGQRPQVALLLLRTRDRLEQMHVALVRRRAVERERAEQAVARLLEHERLAAHVEPEPAEGRADVRGEQAGGARCGLQLRTQRGCGAVPVALVARLGRNHDVAHERAHALGDRGGVAHVSFVA